MEDTNNSAPAPVAIVPVAITPVVVNAAPVEQPAQAAEVTPPVVVAPVVSAPVVTPPVKPVDSTPVFDVTNIDVALLIDTSGTMMTKDLKGGVTRLQGAKESTVALAAEAGKYDSDGITVVRFASKVRVYDGVTENRVEQIFAEFRPMGSTNTKEAVETTANLFLKKRAEAGAAAKPGCIVVITDGEPDDKIGLAQVIVDISKKLNSRSELGILFVQVGNDPDATAYLAKLNNDLTSAGAKFDIVAVTRLEDLEDISPAEIFEMAFTD